MLAASTELQQHLWERGQLRAMGALTEPPHEGRALPPQRLACLRHLSLAQPTGEAPALPVALGHAVPQAWTTQGTASTHSQGGGSAAQLQQWGKHVCVIILHIACPKILRAAGQEKSQLKFSDPQQIYTTGKGGCFSNCSVCVCVCVYFKTSLQFQWIPCIYGKC